MGSLLKAILVLILPMSLVHGQEYRASSMSAIMNDKTKKQMAAQVKGVLLDEIAGTDMVNILKKQVYDQRMLIFRDQAIVDDEEFKEIGLMFGNVLDDSHTQHERAQEKEVMVLSNDEKLGVNIEDGRLWHVGGFGYDRPYSISMLRVTKYAKGYPFVLIPLDDIVESLPPEKKALWDRLWIRTGVNPDVYHPLIYHHPITTAETMIFDMESMYELILDYGTANQKTASDQQLDEFQTDLFETLIEQQGIWHYSHKWQEGDVILFDNQSVGQLYLPASHLQQDAVGVFRMHRIDIMGANVPTKKPGTPKPKDRKLSNEPPDDDDEVVDIEDDHVKVEL